jgi:hypothetical protein
MADTKISALPAATTPLAGTEVLPIVQSGATDKVSVANLTAGRDVSASSYTPTGATIPANGIYSPAANATGFGNVGVETFRTTADNTIQVGSTTNATAKLFLYANNSVGDASQNAAAYFRQDGTNHIQVWAGPGGNVRGYWTSAGNLVIEDENLVIGTSGKGIDFSATPGTGTSELLADYEEGTFTPTIVGTGGAGVGTYTTQVGQYTKVGRQVTVQIALGWSAHTATGDMFIEGLPFTCSSVRSAISASSYDMTLAALNYLGGRVTASGTSIELLNLVVGGGAWSGVAIDTSVVSLIVTATYTV